MDWSIQQIAKLAGTTSRTLRHYDEIGLLRPSRIAANGYRHYDEDALVRLQRILLLRQLGLGLEHIAEVLAQHVDETVALRTHLDLLRDERARLDRQIAAVQSTVDARTKGAPVMATTALDGFDHSQYSDEVAARWGKRAAQRSDEWWRGKTDAERADWRAQAARLGEAWTAAAEDDEDPAGERAQELAAAHVSWLAAVPGTPAADGGDITGYVLGLGEMYVADPRFAQNYGGQRGATFVRDALRIFVQR